VFATSNEYQGQLAGGLPAYGPVQEAWATRVVRPNPIYAFDPFPVMQEAATLIDPLWGNVRYDREKLLADVVISAVTQGNSIESVWPTYQEQLVLLAESTGYQVVTAR
jgi:multiple sugar transport system substrate-binding protein